MRCAERVAEIEERSKILRVAMDVDR